MPWNGWKIESFAARVYEIAWDNTWQDIKAQNKSHKFFFVYWCSPHKPLLSNAVFLWVLFLNLLKVYVEDISERVHWPSDHFNKKNKLTVVEAEAMAQPRTFFWWVLFEFESSSHHQKAKWLQLKIVICKKFCVVLEIELLNTSYLLHNCIKQIKWGLFCSDCFPNSLQVNSQLMVLSKVRTD